MNMRIVAVTALLAFVCGCASGRDPYSSRTLTDLRPGVSSLSDAQFVLGRPTSSVRVPDGSLNVTWPPQSSITNVNGRVVRLKFDAENRLIEILPLPNE